MKPEAILIKALNKCGNKSMAANYLNCDNSQLPEAVCEWEENHGYIVSNSQVAMYHHGKIVLITRQGRVPCTSVRG